jgi:hypothetical protein|tara:strand:- start:1878 stop:2228 length:351 start_codon:yes stop_codon:yes gene_type:complete
MTAFTKENLIIEGKYLTYMPDWKSSSNKFVARFRTAGIGSFATCLRKNFTVEEYFARMDAGESPLPIAESKGYILPHIKKEMKRGGFPLTPAGKAAWFDDYMAKIEAKHPTGGSLI